jgi:hypothetical protein
VLSQFDHDKTHHVLSSIEVCSVEESDFDEENKPIKRKRRPSGRYEFLLIKGIVDELDRITKYS